MKRSDVRSGKDVNGKLKLPYGEALLTCDSLGRYQIRGNFEVFMGCYPDEEDYEKEWGVYMQKTDDQKKLNVVEEAVIFATIAHAGMKRKGHGIPYILHPLEAAAIVSEMTGDENVIAAAVLHDVLEDTDVTYEELEQKFGYIAKLVEAETEDKRVDLPADITWKVRKQETVERLRNEARMEVKMLALADKLSNIRSIHRAKETLGEKVWDRFNQKDVYEQGRYYISVAKALSELRRYAAWKEYVWLIELVFGENILLW